MYLLSLCKIQLLSEKKIILKFTNAVAAYDDADDDNNFVNSYANKTVTHI